VEGRDIDIQHRPATSTSCPAKALDLTIPPSLLARTDQVID